MRRTDYSKIAAKYDQSTFRGGTTVDRELADLAARRRGTRVLDLACGTGNWLLAQTNELGREVRIVGADFSAAMLGQARAKVPGVPLLRARAEQLPFESGAFDYVTTRFAFHHFEDKFSALDELVRVLAPGGTFTLSNIAPEAMHRWWIYRAFPETVAIDAERFWSVHRIEDELEARGLEVRMAIETRWQRIRLAKLVEEARRRDASELALLGDAIYRRRLAELERTLAKGRTEKWWTTPMAIVRLVAFKLRRPGRAARSRRAAPPRPRGRAPARG